MCGASLAIAPGQVLADAVGVADVEVQPDRRGVQPFGDFQVLVGRLQQQPRLGLDQEQARRSSWACSASGLSTSTNRSIACWRDWPGASGPPGSVVMCGAPSSAQSEGAAGCGRSGPGGNARRAR